MKPASEKPSDPLNALRHLQQVDQAAMDRYVVEQVNTLVEAIRVLQREPGK